MAECTRCESGKYQDENGRTTCKECEAGSFCVEGAASPLPCPAGRRSNASLVMRSAEDCIVCSEGTFCATGSAEETQCAPGTFTDSPGQGSCDKCAAGTYQAEAGQTSCKACEAGNYCVEGSSAPLPCPAGRRSDPSGKVMTSVNDCVICGSGTFCATGSAEETQCAPGTFSNMPGVSECSESCHPGSYSAAGATACTECEVGKYASFFGQSFCVSCPFPLSSASGSDICSVCTDKFFLSDSNAEPTNIFTNPDKHCKACPPKVQCGPNVSLETLPIPDGSWRDGTSSSRVYDCFVSQSGYSPCRGSARRSESDSDVDDSPYCIPGHRGPLCQVCVDPTAFYDTSAGRCLSCSKQSKLARFFGVLVGAAAFLLFSFVAVKKLEVFGKFVRRVTIVAANVSALTKAKILISFYQVFNTLGEVYGVHLHQHFTGWLNFLSWFDVPAAEFIMPGTCVGSMPARLALNSLWPVAVVGFAVMTIGALGLAEHLSARASRGSLTWVTRDRAVYATLVIVFLVLPNVSRSIFSAKKCVSFEVSDVPPQSRSYLLADLGISCSGPEFRSLETIFWVFFVLWPVLVPFAGLALVLSIQGSVRARRVSNLANACRFLWRDYEPGVLYWEIVDMLRKILLTAVVLFVDTKFGDVRLLRLWLATAVSIGFLVLLALVRPFKQAEDLYLACCSNLLLTLCFLSGIAIKLCEDEAWVHSCEEFLGLGGSYQANVFVVVITVVMLAVSLGVIAVKTYMTVRTGTIRLAVTGREPVLELPVDCSFHCFLSHAWRTGQDQTHTVARQLQLLVPEIKVWLDVDNLHDVGKLEEAVCDSAVFVIFLSDGYFRSANCRRELYTALTKNRPIVTVREADRDKGGASVKDLKQECMEFCRDFDDGPDKVVGCVFAEEPVVWVRVRDFQIASLKLVVFRMLKYLPYYHNHTNELEKGLKVAGEVGPCVLDRHVLLLVCNENSGAQSVAEELQMAGRGGVTGASSSSISVQSADLVLDRPPEDAKMMLMLYLNKQTFLDAGNSVGALAKKAIDCKIPIIPVHEQDPDEGGCVFGEIYDRTPGELLRPPYNLWDTLAVPLYPAAEHRTISMRHILLSMGAKPVRSARAFSKQATHADATRGIQGVGIREVESGQTEDGLTEERGLSLPRGIQAQLTDVTAVEPAQRFVMPGVQPAQRFLMPGVHDIVHAQYPWNPWNVHSHWQQQTASWFPMASGSNWEGAPSWT